MLASPSDDLLEVLDEPLSRTEGRELPTRLIACLQEGELEAVAPNVVSEPLDALLRPSLDALQELTLVLVVELLDAPLKLDLRGAEWVDLPELLQIEESLGDRQLVAAARGGQEPLEPGSVGQLQEELVDLPQRLRIHILELLPLQDGLHEERPHLVDVGLLQLHLREDLRDRLLKVVLEGDNELTTSSGDQLLAFLEDERRHDVVVVQGRHLDLYSLDPIPTDEAGLCVPTLLRRGLSELEGDQPLDLGLEVRILRISSNVWDI